MFVRACGTRACQVREIMWMWTNMSVCCVFIWLGIHNNKHYTMDKMKHIVYVLLEARNIAVRVYEWK